MSDTDGSDAPLPPDSEQPPEQQGQDGISPNFPMMRWPLLKEEICEIVQLFDAAQGSIAGGVVRDSDIPPMLSVLGLKPESMPDGALSALEESGETMVDPTAPLERTPSGLSACMPTAMRVVPGAGFIELVASCDAVRTAKSRLKFFQQLYDLFAPPETGILVTEANAVLRMMGFPIRYSPLCHILHTLTAHELIDLRRFRSLLRIEQAGGAAPLVVQAAGSAASTELAKQRRDHLAAAGRSADLKARTQTTITKAEADGDEGLMKAMTKVLVDAAKDEQEHREAAATLMEQQNALESASVGNNRIYKPNEQLVFLEWARLISSMVLVAEFQMDGLEIQYATIHSLYKLVCPFAHQQEVPLPFAPYNVKIAVELVCEHNTDLEPIETAFARAGGEGTLGCLISILGDPQAPQPIRMLIHSMRRLRSAYALFDEDGEGDVDADEFGNTLTKLFQWRPTKFIMEKLLKVADPDGDGTVDFDEFVIMMTTKAAGRTGETILKIRDSIDKLQRLFWSFDVENLSSLDFAIRSSEFSKVLRVLGRKWNDDELEQMLKDACSIDDSWSEGDPLELSFVRFANVMTLGEDCENKRAKEVAAVLVQHFDHLEQLFAMYDDDGSGSMDKEELAMFLTKLGLSSADVSLLEDGSRLHPDVAGLVEVADRDKDNEIEFTEFIMVLSGSWTDTQLTIHERMAWFCEVFAIFDPSNKGFVTLDEFAGLLQRLADVPREEVEETVQMFDEDGNGEIDYIEFVAIMASGDPQVTKIVTSHISNFREVFDLFDRDQDGSITFKEYSSGLQLLGVKLHEDDERHFIEADTDDSGEMEFAEFISMLLSDERTPCLNMSLSAQIQELRESFQLFDVDATGILGPHEIGMAFKVLGINRPESVIVDLISEIDLDGNGVLDFAEYCLMMMSLPRSDSSKGGAGQTSQDQAVFFCDQITKCRNKAFGGKPPVCTNQQELKEVAEEAKTLGWTDAELDQLIENLDTGIKFPSLDGLDKAAIRNVCRQIQIVFMPAGSAVCLEDTAAGYIVQVLQGELSVWVKNPVGEEKPGVWGKLSRSVRALQPMLRHAVRVLPAPHKTESLTSATLRELELKLIETSTAVASLLKHGQECQLTDLSDPSSKPAMSAIGAQATVLLTELQSCVDKVKSHHMVLGTEMMLTKSGTEEQVAAAEATVFEMKLLTTQLWETKVVVTQMFKAAVAAGAGLCSGESSDVLPEPEPEPEKPALARANSMIRRAMRGVGKPPAPERGRLLGLLSAGDSFSYGSGSEGVQSGSRNSWGASCFSGNEDENVGKQGATLLLISKRNYTTACLEEQIKLIQAMACHFPYMPAKRQMELALHLKKRTFRFNDVMLICTGTARVTVSGDYGRPKSVVIVPKANLIHYTCTDGSGQKFYTANVTAASQEVAVFMMPREVFEKFTASTRVTKKLVENAEARNSEQLEQIEQHLQTAHKLLTPRRAAQEQHTRPGQRQMLEVLGEDADISLKSIGNLNADDNSLVLQRFAHVPAVHQRVATGTGGLLGARTRNNLSIDGSRSANFFLRNRSMYELDKMSVDPSLPLQTRLVQPTPAGDFSDKTLQRPSQTTTVRHQMSRSRATMTKLQTRQRQRSRGDGELRLPQPPPATHRRPATSRPSTEGGRRGDEVEHPDEIARKLLGTDAPNPSRRRLVDGIVRRLQGHHEPEYLKDPAWSPHKPFERAQTARSSTKVVSKSHSMSPREAALLSMPPRDHQGAVQRKRFLFRASEQQKLGVEAAERRRLHMSARQMSIMSRQKRFADSAKPGLQL